MYEEAAVKFIQVSSSISIANLLYHYRLFVFSFTCFVIQITTMFADIETLG